MSLPPHDSPDDQQFADEGEPSDGQSPPRSRAIIAVLRRHQVAVVAIALISGFLLYTLVLDRPDQTSPPSAEPTTTYAAPPTTTTEAEADHGGGTDADHNTPMGVTGQYRVVARGFAQDFTTPGPDWRERVSRWVTPHLAEAYKTTDIRRVQQATLVDLTEYAAGASVSDFIATYDTGLELAIRVEYSSTGWQVSTCQPMKTAY